MYTILMKDDKSLISTESRKIYQRDSFVGNDKLQFIIPSDLGGDKDSEGVYHPDIKNDCTCILTYKDPSNTVKTAILDPQVEDITVDDTDKVFYKYYLPVTMDLTRFAGGIALSLSFINTEYDFAVHSSEYTITVYPLSNQYAVYDQQAIDDTLAKLNDVKKDLAETKLTIPNDIGEEDNRAKLLVNGELIGEGVELPDTGVKLDSSDGISDGIIEIDDEGNVGSDSSPVINIDDEGQEG